MAGGTSHLKRVGSISVKVRETQGHEGGGESIKDLFRQRFKVQPGGDRPFQIRNLTEILQAQEGVQPHHDAAAGGGGGYQLGH
ncbi:MAG: hypothetical protein IPH37_16865 [Burkholderiales bacterium]|nr:hypothetical protein [Burkholderiales bacterium]